MTDPFDPIADGRAVHRMAVSGGVAIFKADVGYAIVGHTEPAIKRIYEAKQRSFSKPCGMFGSFAMFEEVIEIGADVEGEPVARDPSRDADADCTDLPIANPGAGESLDPPRPQSVVAAHANHHFFEVADVTMDVAPVGAKVENRVANNLPWTVVGHVTTASCF